MSVSQVAVVAAMMQLASPTGSNYNEDWTIKLKGGQVYHSIELETNLKNKSTIKKVTVDIGGTPIVSPKGEILDLLDKLYQKHATDGRICLDLSKFEYRSPAGIYRTALATSVYDDITLKIEFGARNTADADAANHDPATPTLKGKAYTSDNPAAELVGGGRVYVPTHYELTQYAAAAGKHDWIFPNGSQSSFMQRMILDESQVRIERVVINRGSSKIREMTRSDIDFGLQKYAGVALQPGYLLLDFTQFGFGANDALHTQGLNFEFYTDNAGAIKTYVEGFDKLA